MACVKSIDRKRNLISIVPLTVSTTVSTQDAELLGNHNHAFRKCRCVQGTNINRIEFNHDNSRYGPKIQANRQISLH